MSAHPHAAEPVQRRGRISVGIGSWTDKEYTGLIFPKGVKTEERLTIYATHFSHVEVNSGSHRVPPREWVAGWETQTPAGFSFDFRLHKAFAEAPEKAAQNDRLVEQTLQSAEPIVKAGKLGAFLLILPASFSPERDRLAALEPLVAKLRPHRLAVELRNRAWIDGDERERTLDFYRNHKLVWVGVDMPRIEGSTIMPPLDEVTNPQLAYLRLHGRRADWLRLKTAGDRHDYEYQADELAEIAQRVRRLAEKAEVVHVVANNHAEDFAPKTALALQKLIGVTRS